MISLKSLSFPTWRGVVAEIGAASTGNNSQAVIPRGFSDMRQLLRLHAGGIPVGTVEGILVIYIFFN